MPEAFPPPAPARNVPALLRRGPFARYAAGESISMTGTWMQAMAQGWVMTELTDKAFKLGLVNFAGSIPMLALTMYGGAVADRFDKRKILLATQVVQIALAVAVGWLIATHQVQIWHVVTAAALLGIAAAFEMPSSSALVPELVAKNEIASAVAVDRAIFHGTRLIGPALAGFLIGRYGTASAFYANAATFVALMIALLTIQPRQKGSEEEEKERSSGMKAGIDYVRGDRPTVAMLSLMAATSLCIFPFMAVMMPLYSKQVLGLDARLTGLLMAVSGVGSLVASVGLLSVPRPQRKGWMVAAAIDTALSLFVLSRAQSFGLAAASLATLAVGTSLNYGLANTTVQERAPGPLRGRVSALAAMSFVGIMPFASLGVTAIADGAGMRLAMAGCAAVYAAAAGWVFAGPGRRAAELAAPVAAAPAEG